MPANASNVCVNSFKTSKIHADRLLYKCRYDPIIEEMLDIIHEHCYEGLAPPWWVDLFD